MNENNGNGKVLREIGWKSKVSEKKVQQNIKTKQRRKCKRSKMHTVERRRGKQRMQIREDSITDMIAAITIIISMCCWH